MVPVSPFGHSFADVGRLAVSAVTKGNEPLDLARNFQGFARFRLKFDPHRFVIEVVFFVFDVDLNILNEIQLAPANQDACTPAFSAFFSLNHRDHRSEVWAEIQSEPLIAMKGLPIAGAPGVVP